MADAVVIGLMRMNRILEIDLEDRFAVVEAGVTNIGITKAVEGEGFFYAPDPSSQLACMIGGNVMMNSGGAHCLKYGVTANNLLGLKFVTIEGEVIEIGGAHLDAAGYDWLGLITGSEGQLGIVTEVTVRILRGPGGRARHARRLQGHRDRRCGGRCHHRVGHHPGRARVHGQALHPCLRGLRPCRLSAGCRGDADHRGRGQHGRAGRLLTRIKAICERFDPISLKVATAPSSRWRSGRAARAPSARWGASAPTTCAWTAPSRPPSCPSC
jgi:glycolate oxidase